MEKDYAILVSDLPKLKALPKYRRFAKKYGLDVLSESSVEYFLAAQVYRGEEDEFLEEFSSILSSSFDLIGSNAEVIEISIWNITDDSRVQRLPDRVWFLDRRTVNVDLSNSVLKRLKVI